MIWCLRGPTGTRMQKLLFRDRGFECCGHTTVRTAGMITAMTYSIEPGIDDKYPSAAHSPYNVQRP